MKLGILYGEIFFLLTGRHGNKSISVRGETDQEEKTVRAMTSTAPNKVSSE
jgi:hypothetical protein